MPTVYFNMKISSTCIIFNGLRINIKDNIITLVSIFSLNSDYREKQCGEIHSVKG